jgi:anti-sigma regulatory factor (Ser/Thr protein kinase)
MPTTTAAGTGRTQPCPDPPRPAHARPPRASLDLGAVITSPRCARAWTWEILREWHLTGLADTAESIVGELVANAVHASSRLPEPVIRLALAFDNGELAILVSDHNPDLPQPQQPAEDALSGRGLLMVEALSDRYGWYPLEGGTAGKAVWAVLKAAPVASSDPAARFTPLAPAWPETSPSSRVRPRGTTHAVHPCPLVRSTRDVRQPYR